ncbi:signal peptidase [Microbacterium sp. AG790]|uniref:signal peptidase I n=1 Tax=Microbacterium sp. AG790 TaxID=2183995 RepID=UPI000F2040A7|nr:signal peptidase I [Microbacterium sp. AG790]RKS90175.1 signal peptidase [Microbacterium sp. AG790]
MTTTETQTRRVRRRSHVNTGASITPADWGWRVWSWSRSVILTAAAAVGIVCILVFGVSLLFGVRPLVVLSGSMEPTIPVGSVVFSQTVPAAQLKPGDIATVERPGGLGLITHRVTSVTPADGGNSAVTMRGDANEIEDPSPYIVTAAGRYVLHVPFIGNIAMMLRTPYGIGFAVALLLALVVVFLLDPARLRSHEPAHPGGLRGAGGGRLGRRGPNRGGAGS